MSITLSWSNPNTLPTTVEIRRSTANITPGNPGTLIYTAPAGTNKYIDTVPNLNEVFYYQLTSINVLGSIASPVRRVVCTMDFGPGGDKILLGNSVFGYMGELKAYDIGFNMNQYLITMSSNETLYKFIRNGQIIYTPGPIRTDRLNYTMTNKVFNTGISSYNGRGMDDPLTAEYRVSNGRKYAPRLSKLFDFANEHTTIGYYGTRCDSELGPGGSETYDLLSAFLLPHPTIVNNRAAWLNFAISRLSPDSYSTVITSDYSAVDRTSIYRVNGGLPAYRSATATEIGSVLVSTTATVTMFPVIEYKGAA